MKFIDIVDIIISDIVTYHKTIYLFIHDTCNISQATKFLHSAKRRMRYNPEKIIARNCKLHV